MAAPGGATASTPSGQIFRTLLSGPLRQDHGRHIILYSSRRLVEGVTKKVIASLPKL